MSAAWSRSIRPFPALGALLVLGACATTAPAALVAGEQASFDGTVVAVDTAPWAYDGHATVTVATAALGTVRVQLPARWNLCQAEAPDDLQALRAGERVQVAGTVAEADAVVVCERAQHHLRRVR